MAKEILLCKHVPVQPFNDLADFPDKIEDIGSRLTPDEDGNAARTGLQNGPVLGFIPDPGVGDIS